MSVPVTRMVMIQSRLVNSKSNVTSRQKNLEGSIFAEITNNGCANYFLHLLNKLTF